VSGGISKVEMDNLGLELQHHIKTFVGVSTKVMVQQAESIERTLVGKAKRVVDKRPKTAEVRPATIA
jgi:phenylacetate-CoA ligase